MGPGATPVEMPRQHFFACPAFALNENRRLTAGNHLQHFNGMEQFGVPCQKSLAGFFPIHLIRLFPEIWIRKSLVLPQLIDEFFQSIQWEGFLKENQGNLKSEFYIPMVANSLIKEGKAAIEILSGGKTWFGVTYPDDRSDVIKSLKKLHDAGEYPAKLWG